MSCLPGCLASKTNTQCATSLPQHDTHIHTPHVQATASAKPNAAPALPSSPEPTCSLLPSSHRCFPCHTPRRSSTHTPTIHTHTGRDVLLS